MSEHLLSDCNSISESGTDCGSEVALQARQMAFCRSTGQCESYIIPRGGQQAYRQNFWTSDVFSSTPSLRITTDGVRFGVDNRRGYPGIDSSGYRTGYQPGALFPQTHSSHRYDPRLYRPESRGRYSTQDVIQAFIMSSIIGDGRLSQSSRFVPPGCSSNPWDQSPSCRLDTRDYHRNYSRNYNTEDYIRDYIMSRVIGNRYPQSMRHQVQPWSQYYPRTGFDPGIDYRFDPGYDHRFDPWSQYRHSQFDRFNPRHSRIPRSFHHQRSYRAEDFIRDFALSQIFGSRSFSPFSGHSGFHRSPYDYRRSPYDYSYNHRYRQQDIGSQILMRVVAPLAFSQLSRIRGHHGGFRRGCR